MSNFSKEFAAARAAGKEYFVFSGDGRTYGTKLKGEVSAPQQIQMYTMDLPKIQNEYIQTAPNVYGTIPVMQGVGNIGVYDPSTGKMLTHKTKRGKTISKKQLAQAKQLAKQNAVDYLKNSERPLSEVVDENGNSHIINQNFHNEQQADGSWIDVKGNPEGQQAFGVAVNALRTHIKPNGNNEGLIHLSSIGDKNGSSVDMWQDYNTGRGYIVDKNSGEILFATDDQTAMYDEKGNVKKKLDPTQWGRYHTGLNGDSYQAEQIFAGARARKRSAREQIDIFNRDSAETEKANEATMLANQRAAMDRGATYLNMPAVVAAHGLWGGLSSGMSYLTGADTNYAKGFGFRTANTPLGFDWYGPNQYTTTGLGGALIQNGVNFGDTAHTIGYQNALDVAGNTLLANIRIPQIEKIISKGKGFYEEVPNKVLNAEKTVTPTGERAVSTTQGNLIQATPEGYDLAGRFGGGQQGKVVVENGLNESAAGTPGTEMIVPGTRTTNNATGTYIITNRGQVGTTAGSIFGGNRPSVQSSLRMRMVRSTNPTAVEGYTYTKAEPSTTAIYHPGELKTSYQINMPYGQTYGALPIIRTWGNINGFNTVLNPETATVETTQGGYNDPYISTLFETGDLQGTNRAYQGSGVIAVPGNQSESNMAVSQDGNIDQTTGFKTAAPSKESKSTKQHYTHTQKGKKEQGGVIEINKKGGKPMLQKGKKIKTDVRSAATFGTIGSVKHDK